MISKCYDTLKNVINIFIKLHVTKCDKTLLLKIYVCCLLGGELLKNTVFLAPRTFFPFIRKKYCFSNETTLHSFPSRRVNIHVVAR